MSEKATNPEQTSYPDGYVELESMESILNNNPTDSIRTVGCKLKFYRYENGEKGKVQTHERVVYGLTSYNSRKENSIGIEKTKAHLELVARGVLDHYNNLNDLVGVENTARYDVVFKSCKSCAFSALCQFAIQATKNVVIK